MTLEALYRENRRKLAVFAYTILRKSPAIREPKMMAEDVVQEAVMYCARKGRTNRSLLYGAVRFYSQMAIKAARNFEVMFSSEYNREGHRRKVPQATTFYPTQIFGVHLRDVRVQDPTDVRLP